VLDEDLDSHDPRPSLLRDSHPLPSGCPKKSGAPCTNNPTTLP